MILNPEISGKTLALIVKKHMYSFVPHHLDIDIRHIESKSVTYQVFLSLSSVVQLQNRDVLKARCPEHTPIEL